MEGGVEAGEGWNVRLELALDSNRSHRRWVVQRREVREPIESLHGLVVEADGLRELLASVDDAMAGQVRVRRIGKKFLEPLLPSLLGTEVSRRQRLLAVPEQPELEGGGSGVHHQDPGFRHQPGQVQSRISGMSSKCSRT